MLSGRASCSQYLHLCTHEPSVAEFVKLWRSVAVDGLDEKTIEEYLQRQGIATMEHVGIKRIVSFSLPSKIFSVIKLSSAAIKM